MHSNQFTKYALSLPRVAKITLAMAVDASCCVLAVWIALMLRLSDVVSLTGPRLWAAAASILLVIPIFYAMGLYQVVFRYSGWPAVSGMVKALFVYSLCYSTLFTFVSFDGIPRTIGIIQPILLLLLVGTSRAFAGTLLRGRFSPVARRVNLPKVAIYGAGTAGQQLAAALHSSLEMRVVGFIDDDEHLHGFVLNGLRVHSPSQLPLLKARHGVTDILLALPSANKQRRKQIIAKILEAKLSVRTIPNLTELAQGKIGASDLRELDIDDLLGRESIDPNQALLRKNIFQKTVLVTGAGGSIGCELCRQILQAAPATLILVEQSEFALYQIQSELKANRWLGVTRLIPLLVSVTDKNRMTAVFETWRPNTVYHAAAYKHVPIVERNPAAGIWNNVFGTLFVAQAAMLCGVSDVVLVSTDKAVRPTNIMGASKRLAEMILQAYSEKPSSTTFTMVRFGNVLGSSGSVVPKFRQQIREGGPVTVTHANVTRYFMTIPEAAQLVIQAGAMAHGGDVFVLDMGQEVKIIDLARRMIELSGLQVKDGSNPDGDIEIQVTGLRPGEKLFEELLIGDNPVPTAHTRIMRANDPTMPWKNLRPKLAKLEGALVANDVLALREILKQLVSGYVPDESVVDWVYLEQAKPTVN